MLKFDCLKIAEHMFVKSLTVADFADASELNILKSELLLKLHVHGKQVNCNRIPSLAQNINFSTPLHISTNYSYQPKEGCPCQSNRFVRSCLFREFPVTDKKTKQKKPGNK